MDSATTEMLAMEPAALNDIVGRIQQVYGDVATRDLTVETIREILASINTRFYAGRFIPYVTNAEFPTIHVTDTGKGCLETDAFLEAVAYEDGDPEWPQYRYGFQAALTCLRTLELLPTEIFYSGGFRTRDKLMFLILMMLHESVHLIEYTDSALTKSEASHTIFFYKEGYRRFGLLSRLSEVTTDADLRMTSEPRIAAIQALPDTPTEDGIEPLVDHSHFKRGRKRVFLGYIAYSIPPLEGPAGGKRRRTYRRRRLLTRRKKSTV
jgi:hypothetical protein